MNNRQVFPTFQWGVAAAPLHVDSQWVLTWKNLHTWLDMLYNKKELSRVPTKLAIPNNWTRCISKFHRISFKDVTKIFSCATCYKIPGWKIIYTSNSNSRFQYNSIQHKKNNHPTIAFCNFIQDSFRLSIQTICDPLNLYQLSVWKKQTHFWVKKNVNELDVERRRK